MQISIIIPSYNEKDSLMELAEWIERVVGNMKLEYEVIFIDDGSNDNSWEEIKKIHEKWSNFRGISFYRNFGKSAALNCGIKEAKGNIIFTMDADIQDNPDEIPIMYEKMIKEDLDLLSGWKFKRYDPLNKTIPSKFFNWVTRKISKLKLHDFNCGLKAYKSSVIKSIDIYGELHRFIPVIANWMGYNKINEIKVRHLERKYGKTKFGLERFIYGFLDLLTITFVNKFGKRPMHFFGTIGVITFFIGGSISTYLIGEKIYGLSKNHIVRNVTDQPLFYLALLLSMIGVQLFLSGFIAELLYKNLGNKNDYVIREKIN